jgi:hypothetical protein
MSTDLFLESYILTSSHPVNTFDIVSNFVPVMLLLKGQAHGEYTLCLTIKPAHDNVSEEHVHSRTVVSV